MRILALGVVTLDIVNFVSHYPPEDSEQRANRQLRISGGNAANTLTVLSQLGHDCSLASVMGDDPDSVKVRRDLGGLGIDTASCSVVPGGQTPVSYVCLNEENGSRTIVHYRELPEFSAADLEKVGLQGFDWIHLEGRNIEQTFLMLRDIRQRNPDIPCSIEIEKPRSGIEKLLSVPDVLLFSKAFACARGFSQADVFLRAMREQTDARLFLAWGKKGGYALDDGELFHRPAFQPGRPVDTLGAGDVFNAGVIDGILRGETNPAVLEHACRLAGIKCGRQGLRNLFDETGPDFQY